LRDDQSSPAFIRDFAACCGISQGQAAVDIGATLQAWSHTLLAPNLISGSAKMGPEQADPPPRTTACLNACYTLNDVVLRIFFYDSELVAEFEPRLAPLRSKAPCSATPVEVHLFRRDGVIYAVCNGEILAAETSENAARAVLLPELVLRAHRNKHWLCIVHAGACAMGSNCFLFPGNSHSGKTTLIAALMQSGIQFLSDDSAAIDGQTLGVAAMPFALMIREGSWPVLASRYPELHNEPVADRFDERVRFLAPVNLASDCPRRVSTLVFSKFSPHRSMMLEPIDSFQALLQLQESGFWIPHDRESIGTFLEWVQSLEAFTFTYSDLTQAVDEIGSVMRRTADRLAV
jgi:hypothetical protein